MKLLKFIICFSIFHTVQILYAQDVKESEFLIYSELYSSKSIHNLEKPSYLCSYDQNNYPSTNIVLLKWSSNNNFQNKNSKLRYNIGLMIGDYVNSNLKSETRTLQNIYGFVGGGGERLQGQARLFTGRDRTRACCD